jgi:hypothetical protein
MKWKLKDRANGNCIISDCGQYRISKYTLQGMDLYMVYHGSKEIGTASSGNAARRIAADHKQRETTA